MRPACREIDPCSITADGITRWRMCKYIARNEFTHSHIRDIMPPVGIEPETLDPLSQNLTPITKRYAEKREPAPFLQTQSGTGARDGNRKNDRPICTDAKREGGPGPRSAAAGQGILNSEIPPKKLKRFKI